MKKPVQIGDVDRAQQHNKPPSVNPFVALFNKMVKVSRGDYRRAGNDAPKELHGQPTWWEFCGHCQLAFKTNRRDMVWVRHAYAYKNIPNVILTHRHSAVCRGEEYLDMASGMTMETAAEHLYSTERFVRWFNKTDVIPEQEG